MKTIYIALMVFSIGLFSSFKISSACAYAESNMEYIMSQTTKAIEQKNINTVKLYTYRAINALEKSKKQFKDCNCEDASISIDENTKNLKMAVKSTSLVEAKMLLNKALKNTIESIQALEDYQSNIKSNYPSDILAMNVKNNNTLNVTDNKSIYKVVDQSLLKYENSLNTIVNTVDCKQARAFANKVYSHCEQQLLKSNLTEGKKYYNLRTKEITAKALRDIGNCQTK